MAEHPAKFSSPILAAIKEIADDRLLGEARILDPFAGVGGIHALAQPGWETVGVEIEPEWAATNPGTICGDSTELVKRFGLASFDAVITSPAYGNRMADNYAGDAKGSRRFTYRIALGRSLSAGNGGGMQWGDDYRALHSAVWQEAVAVLKPGGLMIVNVSNHIRQRVEQPVVEWHLLTLLGLGLYVDSVVPVTTRRMRFGDNGMARVTTEKLLVFTKPSND